MSQDLIKHLQEIQDNIANAHPTLPNFIEMRDKAQKAFDKRINELLIDNELLQKMQVPKAYLTLWKTKTRHIKLPLNWRYILSTPFIYSMIFPSVFFHIGIEIYHQVCFRLYGIPLVNGKEYFIYDRQLLSWLNIWEKINCIYCSYVNNLIRYSAEIGGRTERYWCPIKYYRRIHGAHSQYDKFVSAKNPKKLRHEWEELRDFSDLK